MLPNVRLLIAAMLASVVALSFGFGVFAALRVNRDPLSRLPANTAALQLVSNQAAVAPATWGAPFGSGLRLSEAQTGGATSDAPALAPGRRDTNESPDRANAWTEGAVTPEGAGDAALVPAALSTPQLGIISPPVTSPPTPPITPPPATAETPAPIANLPETSSPPVPIAAVPAPTAPLASPDVTKAAESEAPISAVPAAAATEPAVNLTPPAGHPADITGSVPDAAAPVTKTPETFMPKPKLTTPRALARRAIERGRVAPGRRVARQTPASAVARFGSNSAFSEPVFQSAPDVYRRPPTTNRPSAKWTAKSAATGGAGAWPSGE
jgi:hypothetical protein